MLEEILFAITWITLPAFWHFLLKNCGIAINRVTIPSTLIIATYTFNYIGIVILFFGLDENRELYVQSKETLWTVHLYTSITITLLISGFAMGKRSFGALHSRFRYFKLHEGYGASNQAEKISVAILFFISLLVLSLYISAIGVNKIALFSLAGLVESALTPEQLRSMMGNDFTGKYHWYKLFMRDLMSVSAFSIFAMYLQKPTFKLKLALLLVLFVATVSMLAATEKGPILWLLIGLGFVYVIIKRDGYINTKQAILGFISIFAIISFFVYIFVGAEDFISAAALALSRLLTGQIQGLYHYIDLFPAQIDYLYGSSFPNLGGLLPHTPYNLPVEVMNAVMPHLSARGVVGSMPTFFWGEMYANFGFIGVVLTPFFVGLAVYGINSIVTRLRPTPLTIGFLVWLIIHYKDLSVTGISAFVFDIYLIVISALVIVCKFASDRRRQTYNKNSRQII